jgi:hypothetical protein
MTLDPFHAKLRGMKTWPDVTKPPSGLGPFRNLHALYVVEHMREDEREEILALVGSDAFVPEVVAAGFIGQRGIRFTLMGADGIPLAIGGAEEIRPLVWQLWSASTPECWSTDWRRLTKACRWVMDGLMADGARRIQVSTLASRTGARRWFERSLRMRYEGTSLRFGRNGEDVARFARIAEG